MTHTTPMTHDISLAPSVGEWPAVRVDGRALHSRRDPIGEARRWAESVLASASPSSDDVVVIFGAGWGWHAQALSERWSGPLFVHEPIEALRPEKTYDWPRPWGQGRPPYEPLDRPDHEVALGRAIGPKTQIHIVSPPIYARMMPDDRAKLEARIRRLVAEVALYRQTRAARSSEWADHAFINATALPASHPASALDDVARGLPAFIVAAGPSLDRNGALMTEARERGVVLAVNHALGALERVGAPPHLTVSIEGRDVSGHFDVAAAYYERLFTATMAHPSLFSLDCHTRFVGHIAEDAVASTLFSALGRDGLVVSGGSATTLAFGLAVRMGADPIILVGADLAYTGRRGYAQGARRDDMRVELDESGVAGLVRARDEMDLADYGDRVRMPAAMREVRSWDGGTVLTDGSLDAQRTWLERAIAGTPDRRVIDATEGGADIEGAENIALRDVLATLPPRPAVEHLLDPPPVDVAENTRRLRRFVTARKRRLAAAMDLVASGLRQLRRARSSVDIDAALQRFARTDRAVGKAMQTFAELDPYLGEAPPDEPTNETGTNVDEAGAASRRPAEQTLAEQTLALYERVDAAGHTVLDRLRKLETALATSKGRG